MSIELSVTRAPSSLRDLVKIWHAAGQTVGLVPTMGALHAGHLSLVDLARRHADRVIVSIFVNPWQFAAIEDLGTYPRTFEQDCARLAHREADLVYAPTAADMYPEGFVTTIDSGGPAKVGLEDAFRPHFFQAVATVVAKLFNQSAADVAIFGEKDYQQLLVVRRMALDLDIPVQVIGAPTIREADGLALSSRNRNLSAEERRKAAILSGVLEDIAAGLRETPGHAAKLLDEGRHRMAEAGLALDYLEVRDAQSLQPVSAGTTRRRVLVAARLGSTRLIDNAAV